MATFEVGIPQGKWEEAGKILYQVENRLLTIEEGVDALCRLADLPRRPGPDDDLRLVMVKSERIISLPS
jgi:hypothetical protein